MKKLSMLDFKTVEVVGEHEVAHYAYEDDQFRIHLAHMHLKGNDGRYSRTLYWDVLMFPLEKDMGAIEFFHKNPKEVLDWVNLNRELSSSII